MSLGKPPASASNKLAHLADRLAEQLLTRLGQQTIKPFLNSKECAELLGVTPEHLCAMRARGEGPPWSGAGKWVRYERGAAFAWLSSLPRGSRNSNDQDQLTAGDLNNE
jgi:hypothetical protein